jgi:FtsP/CotA-like multicopper oxidase with cupredoxin domain
MLSRRRLMTGTAAALATGAVVSPSMLMAQSSSPLPIATTVSADEKFPPGEPGKDYTPVHTPNGVTAPFKVVDGVKVFHLIASEFEHEFAPGLTAICWGYDGRTPGPTLEAVEGDHLRIYVTNRLPAPTTVHWHGILLPAGMDGVTGLSQAPIQPGETFMYEFKLNQYGTYMYHSHFDEMTQQGLGMMGMFIIHPRKPVGPKIDRDFAIMLSEWAIEPGTRRPNTLEMTDFNVLTMNSRAFPGTAPLVVQKNQRVRIRFGNLGAMHHHPIHLHGFTFRITETDGGPVPESAQWPGNTVLVTVGATRAVEFVADAPGDWAMHCHMTHHAMNQMGHDVPNMIGVDAGGLDSQVRSVLPGYMTMGQHGMGGMGDMGMAVPHNSLPMVGMEGPFGYIDMGGMFTIVKVRDAEVGFDDPGWYENPPGTVAVAATAEALRRDGINVDRKIDGPRPSERAGTPDASTAAPTHAASHSDGNPATTPATAPTSAPAAVAYACPMHPEVTDDEASRCPKCGMKLVPQE